MLSALPLWTLGAVHKSRYCFSRRISEKVTTGTYGYIGLSQEQSSFRFGVAMLRIRVCVNPV